MAEVRVRNLEQWIVDAFRSRARLHGHSLEGELRQFLRDEVTNARKQLVAGLRRGLDETESRYGRPYDSAAAIRDDRDRRE
jgi:plasmid stability protein